MPAAARGLKQYLSGTLASKVCDNEHTLPSLGHTEILAVEGSPRDVTRPALQKGIEDNSEIVSSVAGNKSRHVFEDDKSRTQFSHNPYRFMEQAAPFSRQPSPLAGDGQVLAGEASANHVHAGQRALARLGDVVEAKYVGPVVGQHAQALRVSLDLPGADQAGALKAVAKALNPSE